MFPMLSCCCFIGLLVDNAITIVMSDISHILSPSLSCVSVSPVYMKLMYTEVDLIFTLIFLSFISVHIYI